jgi:phosphoribosylaminoimidazole-succinocarboxamide synthase
MNVRHKDFEMSESIHTTNFDTLRLVKRGKVRDMYEVDGALLIVATDRISAFDVVMSDPIPDKGKILTQISLFWFERFKDLCPNHIITGDVDRFPAVCQPYREQLALRSMLVRKAEPLPVECVVRGYLAGSGWKEYQQTGKVCGIELPPGLQQASKLEEPIFTPATKAETGHDENITVEEMKKLVEPGLADRAIELSLEIYRQARDYAATRGIIIADTKFEFGLYEGELILIDELLTPDSSRFWPADEYAPGRSPASYDKQFLRDYLEQLDWDKSPPPPPLPQEIVDQTRARYLKALEVLTGKTLPE